MKPDDVVGQRMRLIQHTEVQIEGSKNRFDWHILAPGER